MKVISRLFEYIQSKNMSVVDAERVMGLSNGYLMKQKKRDGDFGESMILRVIENCPDISLQWLMTGEGDMIKKTHPSVPQVKVVPLHQPKAIERKHGSQTVYLYDLEASAGLKAMFDNRSSNIIDTITIPNLPKCDGAMHVVGDSMYPLLKSGDIVLYKQIQPLEENLCYGEMYILSYQMDDEFYVVCKYIKKSDKGFPYITLASQNPHHADRDIDFRRVDALAMIKAMIRINSMS